MSDYYFDIISKTRHAELAEEARQNALAKQLPRRLRRPGPLARLWDRLFAPATEQPTTDGETEPVTAPRLHATAVRHA